MHLPDGILPVEVVAAGYAVTGVATWYSLRRIDRTEDPRAEIPKASLFTAAFFVASWVHIPLPPTSVHLVLNGLMGVVLGWYAFPAVLIGLFFQAVLFGHGGLTTLGVNAAMMGLPAIMASYLFRLRHAFPRESRFWTGSFAFVSGALGLGVAALVLFVVLIGTVPSDLDPETARASIYALAAAHAPLMLIEGAFTASVVLFLQRLRPGFIDAPPRAAGAESGG